MPSIEKFSASVVVDGKEVEEYGTEKTKDTVTSYIPSNVDQCFTIKMHSEYSETVSFSTYVDGQAACGHLVTISAEAMGANVDATSYRPFVFGAIRLSDDDTLKKDKATWADLGCIEIKIRRIKQNPPQSRNVSSEPKVKDDLVHERSKKAGAHRIKLGDLKTRPAVAFFSVEYIDPLEKPYATIRFLYRPKGLLQAQSIMPYVREENQIEEVDNLEAERAAVAEKEEQLQALLAQADRVRVELNAQRARAGIKREASPIRIPSAEPPRKRHFIDLTED